MYSPKILPQKKKKKKKKDLCGQAQTEKTQLQKYQHGKCQHCLRESFMEPIHSPIRPTLKQADRPNIIRQQRL